MSRFKDRAILFMLGLQRSVTGEEIAKAIERAGSVGRPARIVSTEHQALVDEIRRDQAATDARIARQVGRS